MAGYKLTEYGFRKLIPLDTVHQAGLEGQHKAFGIISRQHCKFMVLSGACTEDCAVGCKKAFDDVFKSINPKEVKSPWGLFTWKVRKLRMDMVEAHVAEAKSAPFREDLDYGERQKSGLETLEAMLQ